MGPYRIIPYPAPDEIFCQPEVRTVLFCEDISKIEDVIDIEPITDSPMLRVYTMNTLPSGMDHVWVSVHLVEDVYLTAGGLEFLDLTKRYRTNVRYLGSKKIIDMEFIEVTGPKYGLGLEYGEYKKYEITLY